MWVIVAIGVIFILIKSGLVWVAVVLAIGVVAGLRAGRVWGVRQLGAFEATERLRRMKSKQGGWGIF